ncbi:DDHD domain containing 2 [Capsaspora owczarzaki ATCC 30864]|uniref:DDHD domain containing 2 n=1 Tax=Capsaspora owczarzaki (strain ATCC 30864) TaxID=595528 RepID=A0A0D2X304_CAPO3|nr:DDHD domain containing 2 [Capsaspora owczarzaki ATCC 30864]KJE93464.1 DDHD domain containing 2 [Capsaspora owczarzaki ATCC 30864]|eukprot:XP_004348077.1 DDHD domain containing 2 [Capsaspora owczarzaki ATCC 30864]
MMTWNADNRLSAANNAPASLDATRASSSSSAGPGASSSSSVGPGASSSPQQPVASAHWFFWSPPKESPVNLPMLAATVTETAGLGGAWPLLSAFAARGTAGSSKPSAGTANSSAAAAAGNASSPPSEQARLAAHLLAAARSSSVAAGAGSYLCVGWKPFTRIDSSRLEQAYHELQLPRHADGAASDATAFPGCPANEVVSVCGGRFDVHVPSRFGKPVYWEGLPMLVTRASWFCAGDRSGDPLIPLEEATADLIESHYVDVFQNSADSTVQPMDLTETPQLPEQQPFAREVTINDRGDKITFHSRELTMLYVYQPVSGELDGSDFIARQVYRGLDISSVDEGELDDIEGLVFVIHGIGSACDLQLRALPDCVDDMRANSAAFQKTHFSAQRGRVELIPIEWHDALHLHRDVDKKLQNISLDTIRKLRELVNDTVLDVMLFTSPVYAQVIIDRVAAELNRLHALFIARNPTFKGKVCLFGHSLGSCIGFDLLAHQPLLGTHEAAPSDATGGVPTTVGAEDADARHPRNLVDSLNSVLEPSSPRALSNCLSCEHNHHNHNQRSHGLGHVSVGVHYPRLNFACDAMFGAGSPMGMFLTVRGHDHIGRHYQLPTCPKYFNIFHPFDPVAFRMEPIIDPQFTDVKPELVPHYTGRKRIHIELRDNISRVSATIKNTFNMVEEATKSTSSWFSFDSLSGLAKSLTGGSSAAAPAPAAAAAPNQSALPLPPADTPAGAALLHPGKLNSGARIDYALQETPIESINEYLFSITAHFVYWRSQDTILFIMNEIFNSSTSPSQ